ncbi:MAG: YraN family protein [Phycisphaerales bacterium]|nr:YraN family protein [Phycisphaerales bacterium]
MVCQDRRSGLVVLVEVKTRVLAASGGGVPASAAIHAEKRRRLVATAKALAAHPRFRGRPVRIDVVTVEFRGAQERRPLVRHFVNAVGEDASLR